MKLDTEKERLRLENLYVFEKKYHGMGFERICGVDEAGRGPLAGPVVAAAVVMPYNDFIPLVNDSKKVSEKNREILFEQIVDRACAYGVGVINSTEIDNINILQATYKAMTDAVLKLSPQPDMIIADAVTIPGIVTKQVGIIKGDAVSYSIACASIIAKVYRDRMMRQYDILYPEYGFARNKGYGSKEHIEAIGKYGLTKIHRVTFSDKFVKKE